MIGLRQANRFYQNKMSKNDEEYLIKYLKKNKNFFVKYPDLAKQLNFPLKDKSNDKVIDLEAYRYKKISRENIDLQNQMTEIHLSDPVARA